LSIVAGALLNMLLQRILIFLFFLQSIRRYSEVVTATNVCNYLVKDGESTSSSTGHNNNTCCTVGECIFYELIDALTSCTNNTVINITTNAVLSQDVTLKYLENVTITAGHRNSIIKCNRAEAVTFVYCKNIRIVGINWEGCGIKSQQNRITGSAIQLYSTSSIVIQQCSFQNSVGQAISLSKVSENVSIEDCEFSNNNLFRGHGVAIQVLTGFNQ